jgi:hypothetical protein
MKACKEKKKDQKKMSSETRKQVVRDEQRRLELIKANGKEITSIMHVIAYNTTSRTITGEARDALIELIMKNGAWDELVVKAFRLYVYKAFHTSVFFS